MKTTLIYVRAAEMVGQAVGEPFPALPVSLLGIRETHAQIARTGSSTRNLVEPPGIEPHTDTIKEPQYSSPFRSLRARKRHFPIRTVTHPEAA